MRVLYIGHYKPGCTSRMRGEYLQALLKPDQFFVVDSDVPIYNTPRLFRSFGWRYYRGPLISTFNDYVKNQVKTEKFDIVWIDKGVFIEPSLLKSFKKNAEVLIHFTPDTAFKGNKSALFYKGLSLYDYCITTKSFELEDYKKAGVQKLLYCTQGYDPGLHKSFHRFSEKKGVVFIGQHEAWREEAIARLIGKNILVTLSGVGWDRFVNKNMGRQNLDYLGKGLFGEAYAKTVSGAMIGLGLLSKKFPEQHTTRTFEIPACGTALAAEYNNETRQFFNEEEVLFFNGLDDMADKIEYYINHPELLKSLTENGYNKVVNGVFDYPGILKNLLAEMNLHI